MGKAALTSSGFIGPMKSHGYDDTDQSNSARHPTHPSIFCATGRGAHRPRKPWWGDRHDGASTMAEGDLSWNEGVAPIQASRTSRVVCW